MAALFPLIAGLALSQASGAPAPEAWLEAQLRARLPAVQQWDIRELRAAVQDQGVKVEQLELGSVGPRTLVIVHGHKQNGRAVSERRWYEVAGFAPAVVTRRALGARTTIVPDMLDIAAVNLLAYPCNPITDPATAVGLRLIELRHAGEVLCSSMLKPVPAVQRGSSVMVNVSFGSVALHTAAIARGDAEIGERVQLFRPVEDVSFSGIVSAPGEVEVR